MKRIMLLCMLLVWHCVDAQVPELVVDFTADGKGTGSNPGDFFDYNGKLMFCTYTDSGSNLWITDGTWAGTSLVKDDKLRTAAVFVTPVMYNGKMIYGGHGPLGFELWMSDGTAAGTSAVSNINANLHNNSFPQGHTVYNGKVYFSADDGIHGFEPWVSDGTDAGTHLLKDINTGKDDGLPRQFTVCNGMLFFSATDAASGMQLWVTDGTEAGTKIVGASTPGNLTVFNNKLYFQADDLVNGAELWVSDGTAAGTQLVKDIVPGSSSSSVLSFTECNGKLCFIANTASGYYELWATDGTETGTQLVKHINSSRLYNCYGKLYFAADAGNGVEPWISDGTEAGTVPLRQVYPNTPGTYDAYPDYFTAFNGKIYFVATDLTRGRQLWVTDTTTASTGPAPTNGTPLKDALSNTSLFVSGGVLYFPALYNNSIGRELYKLNLFPASVPDVAMVTKLIVYPNPTRESITIQYTLTTAGSLQYRLYDINGKCVGTWQDELQSAGARSKQLNISNFAPAVYQLQIEVNGKVQAVTVVKQ